ncbi:hypothetical protein KORDIASMS9_01851 [Kordia sp. SMS9]|uniref:T9SS type A sorting domain-containing protein n=1 Tax=Kordia sp. SMS9 TaxID=2282170 RepID=UPI000E0DF8C9|nr:T9SS type A sorting domain-containing protein [Kordia sp. SMS9]AXG69626.1 hypothetical protein KORDIASMS9_01851 [Kordia sp. SMS9]
MRRNIIVFLIAIFLPAIFFAQVEIHITPDGIAVMSDGDAGAQNNPYSLDYILSNASVFFGIATNSSTTTVTSLILHHGANGENFETNKAIFLQNRYNLIVRSADPNNPVKIKAEQNLIQALDGSSTDLLFTIRDSNNIVVKDIIFEGIDITDTNITGYSLVNFGYNDDILIENLTIQNNWGAGGRGLWLFGWGNNTVIRNCLLDNMGWTSQNGDINPFYDTGIDDVDGNPIMSCYGYAGALIQGNENEDSYEDITVENCNFMNLTTGCNEVLTFTGNVKKFQALDNIFQTNTNIGIAIAGHYPTNRDPDTNTPINANLNQARYGIVRGNEVYNSNFARGLYPAGGIYCDGCKDVVIEGNLTQGNDVGISVGCENAGGLSASNVTVINNTIIENPKGGIYIGSFLNDDNVGGTPSTVQNCIIRNNTLYKNGMIAQPNGEVFVNRSENNEFYNNILHMRNNAFGVIAFCDQPFSNFNMDYNLFYRDDEIQNSRINDACIEPNSNLSGNQNSLFGAPTFVDVNSNNFDIQQASAAINTGDPNTQILTTNFLNGFYHSDDITDNELDYGGNIRIFNSVRIDIGAYESIFEPLSVGAFDNSNSNITIYPNSFQTDINIKMVSSYSGTVSIRLYNLQGKLLENITFEKIQESQTEKINFGYISNGLYFIDIKMGNSVEKIKILKQ